MRTIYLIFTCVLQAPTQDLEARKNLLYINQGIDADGIPHFEEAAAAYGLDDASFSVQSAFFDYDRGWRPGCICIDKSS